MLGVLNERRLMHGSMAPDKRWYQVNIFLIFSMRTLCFGYSVEVPQGGTSNEYPQHIFFLF